MKKSQYIKLVLVSGIMAACANHKPDPNARLYDRLHVRTDTSGVYTYGEPGYDLYPYGDIQDNDLDYHTTYIPIGYGGYGLAPHSSIESAHVSRGGFGSSSFHVSS